MRDEKGYEEDQSDANYWIGRCLARMNKPAEAIAALSEAIRLDPESAAAYQARGRLYQKLGEQAKAQADFTKAKQLRAND
jgi:Flp pilus assembly protein TadD